MTDSAKDTLMLGFSLTILASIMTIFLFGVQLKNKYASILNNKTLVNQQMANFREFNKYDMGDYNASAKNHIYGDELIELIRAYYNTSFTIYIDRTSDSSSSLTCNHSEYIKDKDKFSYESLQRLISPKAEFHTYLCYNGTPPEEVNSYQSSDGYKEVTGIAVKFVRSN